MSILHTPSTLSTTSAYHRHLLRSLQYIHFYGGTLPTLPTGKNERQLVEESFEFIRSPSHTSSSSSSTEKEIAKKYYDQLYREFALVDLSRYKDKQVGLRWRTKDEVLAGVGQFTCAGITCPRQEPSGRGLEGLQSLDEKDEEEEMEDYEMNFAYTEHNVQKNALVKVRCCKDCARKLRRVEGGRKEKKRRRSGSREKVPKERHRDRRRSRSRSPGERKDRQKDRRRKRSQSPDVEKDWRRKSRHDREYNSR